MSNTKRAFANNLLLAIGFSVLLGGGALFAQEPAEKAPEGVYRPGDGVMAPKPFYTPQPEYTDKARKEKINGTVLLTLVVMADGHVRDVKIIKGLDKGLDKQALTAVRTWRFEPGSKDGKPVAVELSAEVTFRLY